MGTMTTNIDTIIYNEGTNEGDRIYTYYNDVVGAMEAFGYSAYLATRHLGEVLCMWDEKLCMPCAVLRKKQMEELMLLGKTEEKESTSQGITLKLSQSGPLDKDRYNRWLEVLQARKSKAPTLVLVEEMKKQIDADADDASEIDNPNNGNASKFFFGTHINNEIVVGLLVLILILIMAFVLSWGG